MAVVGQCQVCTRRVYGPGRGPTGAGPPRSSPGGNAGGNGAGPDLRMAPAVEFEPTTKRDDDTDVLVSVAWRPDGPQ